MLANRRARKATAKKVKPMGGDVRVGKKTTARRSFSKVRANVSGAVGRRERGMAAPGLNADQKHKLANRGPT